MSSKFNITSEFKGYHNKVDITKLPPGLLVKPSQNVIPNEGERVAIRKGYTLDGDAGSNGNPIESAYDFQTRFNAVRHLRSYDDELEYRYVASDGTVTWRRLADGFTSVAFNYAEYWDTTELIARLMFVNGTSNIYDWSGAITTFDSATTNTITKEGSTTWAEEGFYTAGTRQVIIDGTTYTYTGGETTTTLTGVTPDPTSAGHSAGAIVHQAVRTTANSSITGLPNSFENDLIGILYNQVYIGSFSDRQVYVSAVDDYTDFSFSATRAPGEGAILTLDSYPTALLPQEEAMYISSGLSDWYQSVFQLAADQTAEALFVQKIQTAARGAAKSQALSTKIRNNIVFLTEEPTLDTLGPEALIDAPQRTNLSEPIRIDFDNSDFTNGQVFYFREQVLIALPAESKILLYDLSNDAKFWYPPMTLPIRRFSIIDGELYGHSSVTNETYKLFTGTSDNGNPINAIAAFSYQNFGDRVNKKNFDEFFAEGYISSNTTLNQDLYLDYEGCTATKSSEIDGSDSRIICGVSADGSLGKQSHGKYSLGGSTGDIDELLPPKFRVIKETNKEDFREMQVVFSTNDVDQNWEILAFGPNVTMSSDDNFDISQ